MRGGHRLERGERATGRHPHLGVRVPGVRRASRSSSRRPPARGRRSRPRRYRSSNVRRPIGSASRGSACSAPVGMPRSSSVRWVRAGSRRCQRRRGVPGSRRYGCQPKATGTARRPVGTTVVSSASSVLAGGRRRPRCGAGTGTPARRRRSRRGSAPGRARADRRPSRHPGRPTSRPWIGRPLPSVPQRQPGRGPRRRRPPGSGAIASRFAHGASSGRPERGARPQRGEAAGQREVLPTAAAQRDAGHPEVGRNVADELAGGDAHAPAGHGSGPRPRSRPRRSRLAGLASTEVIGEPAGASAEVLTRGLLARSMPDRPVSVRGGDTDTAYRHWKPTGRVTSSPTRDESPPPTWRACRESSDRGDACSRSSRDAGFGRTSAAQPREGGTTS